MKRIAIISILWGIFCLQCNSYHIFNPEDKKPTAIDYDDGTLLLYASIRGGLDNLNYTLQVSYEGTAMLTDYGPYQLKRTTLSESNLKRIITIFDSNSFLELESATDWTSLGSEALTYEMNFNYGQNRKNFAVNSFTLNESTEPYIQEIYHVMDLIVNDGLAFDLSVDKTLVRPDENLTIFFKVTNTSTEPMNFNLKSTQTHDIVIRSTAERYADSPAWNWANQQTFEETRNNRALPGETSSEFKYIWDCRDNQGNRVQGQYAISAELLSQPGGVTKEIIVTVVNK